MWQVVTSPKQFELLSESEGRLFGTEIDALLEALAALQPVRPARQMTRQSAPAEAPKNLLPFRSKTVPQPAANKSTLPEREVISALEMPRSVQATDDSLLPREVREALLQLRATILLAAEREGLRSVLLCDVDAQSGATELAAPLSQLLAEYERLKVAYVAVSNESANLAARRKVLPIGYTFQIRRTRRTNLYEIASSLGIVRLDDWLRWWSPSIVMQEMRKMFDLVVMQAPAITTNPDVALLAAAVDGVILVATENVTSYASIEAATKRLRAANARILGVAMNPAVAAPSAFSGVKTRVREFLEAIAKGK